MALGFIRAFLGDVGALRRLQELPPSLTFYSEDDFSYLTMEGYVQGLLAGGQSVVYLTSSSDDPVRLISDPAFQAIPLQKLASVALTNSKAPVLVMTMPDLGSLHVARPAPTTRCVYIFHALVSVHRQYRVDAFDHYDDFFCTGEYQVRELTRRFEMLGRPCPRLHRVGYYKLDRVHRHFLLHQKRWTDRPVVLMAPSWHPGNLLEGAGLEMVDVLLAQDFRVVVRPHPAFFASIYKSGQSLMDSIERRFGSHPHFLLDKTMNSEQYFFEADLLVTDWSGSAFEYAFGTERPVLFVDTPPKVRNPSWQDYGMVPFEVAMREKVGQTMAPEQARQCAALVIEMLGQASAYKESLVALRQSELFNFGQSAQVGTELLLDFMRAAA